MAARQPLALVGGAYEAYSTGDDIQFRSLGLGVAAPLVAGSYDAAQAAATSGTPPAALRIVGGAHTGLANSEVIDIDWALARTVTLAGGGAVIALQRAMVVRAPTYAAAAAQVITDAASFCIEGSPTAGANTTITYRSALLVRGGDLKLQTTGAVDAVFRMATYIDTKTGYIALYNSDGTMEFSAAKFLFSIGALRVPDGSLAAPAFAFTTETNTGWRLAAAGDARLVVAGTDRLNVASSGLVTVTGRITGVSAPEAASDAVRADEALFFIAAVPGTLNNAGGATTYSGPYTTQTNPTEGQVSLVVPRACVIRNLRVRRVDGAAMSDTVTFSVFVNEALSPPAGPATLEVVLGSTDQTGSDVDGSITLAAGDRLNMRIVMGASYSNNSAVGVRWSLDATRL